MSSAQNRLQICASLNPKPNQGKFKLLNSCISRSSKKISSPKTNPYAFFYGKNKLRSTEDSCYIDWAINLAILRHNMNSISENDLESRRAFVGRIMTYLFKFMPLETDRGGIMQLSPFRSQYDEKMYFRESDDAFLTKLTTRYIEDLLAIPRDSYIVRLVSDSSAVDFLKRSTHMLYGNSFVFKKNDVKKSINKLYKLVIEKNETSKNITQRPIIIDATNVIQTIGLHDIDDKEKFRQALRKAHIDIRNSIKIQIYHRLTESFIKKKIFTYYDISNLVNYENNKRKKFNERKININHKNFLEIVENEYKIKNLLRQISFSSISKFIENNKKNKSIIIRNIDDKMRLFDKHVFLASSIKVGGQSVLYVAKLVLDSNDNPQPIKDKFIDKYIRHQTYKNGFTTAPHQLAENWSTQTNKPYELFKHLLPKIPNVKFNGDYQLADVPTVRAMLDHPIAQQFVNISQHAEDKPLYLTILTNTTCALLEGLDEINVSQILANRSLSDLNYLSNNRILAAMQEAVKVQQSPIAFLNAMHIIHAEIANQLAIARPYTKKTFSQTMATTQSPLSLDETDRYDISNNTMQYMDFHPTNWLDGVVLSPIAKNSGTRCLSSIVSACEALKIKKSQTKKLNILLQSKNFFELNDQIRITAHNEAIINTDHFDVDLDTMVNQPVNQPIDLYVCEFHHNTTEGCDFYREEPVSEQINAIFKKKMAGYPLTVAIDVTLIAPNQNKVEELLMEQKSRIESGELNVILYRSAQKFDMLGMDNYNGGFAWRLNNPDNNLSINEFNRTIDNVGLADLTQTSFQGLTHLQKFATKHLQQYRQTSIDNTKRLSQRIPSAVSFPNSMLLSSGSRDTAISIAHSEDNAHFFLDILINEPCTKKNQELQTKVHNAFQERIINDDDFNGIIRGSYGFPITSLCRVPGKLRLAIGLDSDRDMEKYVKFFINMNNEIAELTGKQKVEYPDFSYQRFLFNHNKNISINAIKKRKMATIESINDYINTENSNNIIGVLKEVREELFNQFDNNRPYDIKISSDKIKILNKRPLLSWLRIILELFWDTDTDIVKLLKHYGFITNKPKNNIWNSIKAASG